MLKCGYFVINFFLLFHVVSKQTKNDFIKKSDFYYNKQTQNKFDFSLKSIKTNI
jgi:hypothetical protein